MEWLLSLLTMASNRATRSRLTLIANVACLTSNGELLLGGEGVKGRVIDSFLSEANAL